MKTLLLQPGNFSLCFILVRISDNAAHASLLANALLFGAWDECLDHSPHERSSPLTVLGTASRFEMTRLEGSERKHC